MNGTPIGGLHHDQVVALVKEGGYHVRLTVGPPTDDSSSTASTPQKVSRRPPARGLDCRWQGAPLEVFCHLVPGLMLRQRLRVRPAADGMKVSAGFGRQSQG